MGYVGLHTHSEYSPLDGISRISEIVQFAVDNKQNAACITDHGNLYGAIKLYESCRDFNINPVIGCELYVEREILPSSESSISNRRRNIFHLIALASTSEGYKNLCKLITTANLENFYYKPLVTREMLAEHNEGLIILSGCLGSEVSQSIVQGGNTEKIIHEYREIFGDRYFLEIQNHGIPEEDIVRNQLARFSKDLNIPLVATQDSHFTHINDADVHDTMLSIQVNKLKSDTERFKFSGSGYHLGTETDMMTRFSEYPEAVTNSGYIADMCNIDIPLHQNLLPQYNRIPSGYTASQYLKEVTLEGMKRRYVSPSYEATMRMYYELEVIERCGFDSYMLIIWDLMRQAHDDGVRCGPGRGSAAGSIVSYALGITNVCPLKYNLVFERFLNLERVKMPDIDLDFEDQNRDKVIKYAADTYGSDSVAQIVTIGTLAAKSAVKGVAKAFGVNYAEATNLANGVPYNQFGATLAEAIETSREFGLAYKKGEWETKVIDTAMRLEGVAKHVGTHAAGVVISPVPLQEIIPLQRPSSSDVTSLVAHYEMDDLAKLGLLKVDFLGLSTLTLISNTLSFVKQRQNIDVNIDNISLEDEKTYNLLQRGNTHGVFQLESYGGRKVLAGVRPVNLEEIAAAVAINRPGPLQGGVLDLYKQRKQNKNANGLSSPITTTTHDISSDFEITDPTAIFPSLADILSETYGTIVYQEQIMQIAQKIAGYSMGEADEFREAMGKKDQLKMAKQKKIFMKRALALGHDRAKLQQLVDLIEPFCGYAFNKSHAIVYALLAYQTAYLRAHYPLEFQCALLNMRGDDKDKLPLAIKDARMQGITILGADVFASQEKFSIEGDDIRYGLMYIKDFGSSAYTALDQGRRTSKFISLEDLLMRCNLSKLNSKAITALIKAGALVELGTSGSMLRNLEDTMKSVRQAKEDIRRESAGLPPVKRRKKALAEV